MGASQSSEPRSVSMDNPKGVIDISEDVVIRLKQGIKKQAKDNEKAEVAAPKKEVQPKASNVTTSVPASHVKQPVVVYKNDSPMLYATPSGHTLSAMDMHRQKEIELQQNDAMWRQRMEQLEHTLKKTNTIMENEYSSAVEDVRKRFATASPIHQLPPCQDLKAKVIACYRTHTGETLKCAEEVAAFRNCVNLNRIEKLNVTLKKTQAETKPAKAA